MSGDVPEGADPAVERHRRILALARGAGRVTVDDLAARFDVTPQTIRRDLNVLARRALLSRVHGGAVVTSGVDNLAYTARRGVATGAKAAIGAAAAALIPNGASLFINIGTTTEAVAGQLVAHRDLLVISNNLNVIDLLDGHDGISLVAVGGEVRRGDRAVVGALAMRFIDGFKVDVALIGASAIDLDGSLLEFAVDEVQVTQTIARNARQVILVIDASKVGRAAPVRVGRLDLVDYLVTDQPLPAELIAACAEHRVQVIEAG